MTDPVKWWTCTHAGIGLPGCPVCDGRLDETAKIALREARDEIARLTAGASGPRIGGSLPEPWPGMGVKTRLWNVPALILCPAVPMDFGGETRFYLVGIPESAGQAFCLEGDVREVWDGRVCIWRRATAEGEKP